MSKRVADPLVDTLQAAGMRACYGVAHAINRSPIDGPRRQLPERACASLCEPRAAVSAARPESTRGDSLVRLSHQGRPMVDGGAI
jgi:hypothetical protein